jgi:hypothetical protein
MTDTLKKYRVRVTEFELATLGADERDFRIYEGVVEGHNPECAKNTAYQRCFPWVNDENEDIVIEVLEELDPSTEVTILDPSEVKA